LSSGQSSVQAHAGQTRRTPSNPRQPAISAPTPRVAKRHGSVHGAGAEGTEDWYASGPVRAVRLGGPGAHRRDVYSGSTCTDTGDRAGARQNHLRQERRSAGSACAASTNRRLLATAGLSRDRAGPVTRGSRAFASHARRAERSLGGARADKKWRPPAGKTPTLRGVAWGGRRGATHLLERAAKESPSERLSRECAAEALYDTVNVLLSRFPQHPKRESAQSDKRVPRQSAWGASLRFACA